MTPRERQLAAIRRELADRISGDAIAIENLGEVAALLGIDRKDVYEAMGVDGRYVAARYLGEVKPPINGVSFTEWGTPSTGDYGTGRFYPLARAESVAEIERYHWPDPGDYDFASAAQKAREFAVRHAVRGPYWHPLFCRACDLLGMENAMIKMVANPALLEAVLERAFIHTLEYCRRLLAACGDTLHILCLGDDFATQRGVMISPELWRRFLKPRYAQLFALGKKLGKPVWFHSCGDITPVLGDLIDIGVNVWETVQLHTLPISAERLKATYGRHMTFFGGVNTQRLPFMKPETVREEVRRCIKVLGKGGGYICGPDHHIKPDVPAENVVALYETIRGFRGAGYNLGN